MKVVKVEIKNQNQKEAFLSECPQIPLLFDCNFLRNLTLSQWKTLHFSPMGKFNIDSMEI